MDAHLIAESGARVSSTPDTELQMGHGDPVCFRPDLFEYSSLGIDCHSNNSSDILTQMRLALQTARAHWNRPFNELGKSARSLPEMLHVEAAFNLGTIKGARAIGMEPDIGSLELGKLADIVIFDATTPALTCVAEHDPVAALVMHASIRDIEMVIIDGQIKKKSGKLVPTKLDTVATQVTGKEELTWEEVSKELLKGRARLHGETEGIDLEPAYLGMAQACGIDMTNIVH